LEPRNCRRPQIRSIRARSPRSSPCRTASRDPTPMSMQSPADEYSDRPPQPARFTTPCGQDEVANHPFFFSNLFLIFYDFIFKNKIIKYYYFFNSPRDRLMALGSLRKYPSHQPDTLQSKMDRRGSLSLMKKCFIFGQK
jgi:hypothetical protein